MANSFKKKSESTHPRLHNCGERGNKIFEEVKVCDLLLCSHIVLMGAWALEMRN